MSQIDVWGTGKPTTGFTEDAVLTNARKLFPTKKAQHIARFIAGKRFLITRVNDEAGAQKLIEGLAKSGIEADTNGPQPPGPGEEATAPPEEEEDMLIEEPDDAAAAPAKSGAPKNPGKYVKAAIAIAGVVGIAIVAGVAWRQMHAQDRDRAAAEARAEAEARAAMAARLEAEADARKQAEETAADKEKTAAAEAERLQKKEAAVMEATTAFEAGNYPQVILLSERFEQMYGPDKRVSKLEQDATFTLKEGARRGNFAAILDPQIKGSSRYEALRQWALQVQERAKPVEKH